MIVEKSGLIPVNRAQQPPPPPFPTLLSVLEV